MGSCGCGDYMADFRLPGPDGTTYTISLYRGCEYCSAPPGVVITRHDADEAETWGDEQLPALDWYEFDRAGVNAEAGIPCVDMDALKQAIADGLKFEDECDKEDRHSQDDEGRKWLAESILEEGRISDSFSLWWPREKKGGAVSDRTPEKP